MYLLFVQSFIWTFRIQKLSRELSRAGVRMMAAAIPDTVVAPSTCV